MWWSGGVSLESLLELEVDLLLLDEFLEFLSFFLAQGVVCEKGLVAVKLNAGIVMAVLLVIAAWRVGMRGPGDGLALERIGTKTSVYLFDRVLGELAEPLAHKTYRDRI